MPQITIPSQFVRDAQIDNFPAQMISASDTAIITCSLMQGPSFLSLLHAQKSGKNAENREL